MFDCNIYHPFFWNLQFQVNIEMSHKIQFNGLDLPNHYPILYQKNSNGKM